jgi:hypothetical protein
MGWVLLGVAFLAYVTGVLLTVRPFAQTALEERMERFHRRREEAKVRFPASWTSYFPDGKVRPTRKACRAAAAAGFFTALVWPVAWPFRRFADTLRTSVEIMDAQAREIEKLRKLAADNGLSWPDGAA